MTESTKKIYSFFSSLPMSDEDRQKVYQTINFKEGEFDEKTIQY